MEAARDALQRSISSRLEMHVESCLVPPLRFTPPAVHAVPPAPDSLALYPTSVRNVASGNTLLLSFATQAEQAASMHHNIMLDLSPHTR
jgi:hypothetical protein